MSDGEQTDLYLIHSDVFPSMDPTNTAEDEFLQNTIDFLRPTTTTHAQIDEDGDWNVKRPERLRFTLVHRNETNIAQCGYQLWNGALLLCDYLLTHSARFDNRKVIELGAGIGLCSLLASRYAAKVICTDHDENLLQLIEQNVQLNDDVCRPEIIRIQRFDWKEYHPDVLEDQIEILLAADLIYDDDLTDLLFNVLTRIFEDQSKLQSIYFTIEKRINFYTDTASVQSPAYDYFLEKLDLWKTKMPELIMEEIPTDVQSFYQCTSIYQRTNELILWHIYHPQRFSP